MSTSSDGRWNGGDHGHHAHSNGRGQGHHHHHNHHQHHATGNQSQHQHQQANGLIDDTSPASPWFASLEVVK